MGSRTIDINMDMGESYGRWRLGDDEGAMPWITSANIACGFHAGDPSTMRAAARLALDHDVAIGAHVGFPDLLGFGRRSIDVTPDEVRDYTAYQLGALDAIVRSEGGRLAHVKPHGALYGLCSSSEEHAAGVAAAIAGLDAGLPLLLLSPEIAPAVEAQGVRLVVEAFPDLNYEPDARLVIEPVKQAWDPDRVAERAVRIVLHRRIDATDGSELEVDARTLCLHGDAPNAVEIARTVRSALETAGIAVTSPWRSPRSRSAGQDARAR
jgi:5-oxoprolinase (ATP-hydrolysing) subunit A